MGHPFLSDSWFEEVERIRAEINPEVPEAVRDLVINLKVTDGPNGDIEARIAGGKFEKGLADEAPTTLSVPYETAKAMFIEADQNATMQAFMSGVIKVEGDMTKLMAMMQAGGTQSTEAEKARELVKNMTE